MAMGEQGPFVSIFGGGTAVGLGPADLLERFAASRDEGAFSALVDRHGPMVLATCRRVLPNSADADDAFQATFLVLARKARSISDPDRLAPWLHGVARRVAVRARSQSARRSAIEGDGDGNVAVAPAPDDARELRAVLDEELAQLPAKYRDPIILCYLEGMTHDEAALQLDWPVGTVRSRLAGGRDRLRTRLARRGFAPGALAVLSPATLPVAAVSRFLQAATVRLACTSSASKLAGPAALLAQGVLTSMFYAKIQTATLGALAVAATLATGTAGVVLAQSAGVPATATASPAAGVSNPPAALSTPAATSADNSQAPTTNLAQELDAAKARIKALEAELTTLRSENPPQPPAPPEGATTTSRTSYRVNGSVVATSPTGEATPAIPPATPEPPALPTLPPHPMTAAQKTAYFGPWTFPLANGKVLYAPAARDRVTVIDSAVGKSFTYKDTGNVTKIVPIFSETMAALMLEGPKVTEAVVLNTLNNSWVRQPLRQPVLNGRISPSVNDSLVYYVVGRSIYALSSRGMRWGVLDLKEPLADGKLPQNAVLSRDSLIVPEGETLHIFNFQTSRWTDASTRDEPDQPWSEPKPALAPATSAPIAEPAVFQLSSGKRMFWPAERDRIIIDNQVWRPADPTLKVVPIFSGGMVGVSISGPRITEVAAHNIKENAWFSTKLREPVLDGKLEPTVGTNSVEYRIGRLIYNLDDSSRDWIITDLNNLPR